MAFNSNTYHANKSARSAYAWIAKARDVKARAAIGGAYSWETDRIPLMVAYARADMRRCLFFRSLNRSR